MRHKNILTLASCIFALNIYGCSFGNTFNSSELINAGYLGIIYGNQNTRGISIYELNNSKNRNIIVGGSDAEYAFPASIGNNFVCIRKTSVNGKLIYDVIQSDMSGKITPIKTTASPNIYSISVSNNRSKLAMLTKSNENKTVLKVYDIKNDKYVISAPMDDTNNNEALKLIWNSDDDIIYIIDQSKSGIMFNIKLNKLQNTTEYPVCCNSHSCITIRDSEYYLKSHNASETKLILGKKTAHTLSLTRDGKFFVYGWLRGAGFETFLINEVKTGKHIEIKLEHPGTALGLQLI